MSTTPFDNTAAFAAAKKILTTLAAQASVRAATDPEWVARRDDYVQRRNRLQPDDSDAIARVLAEDGKTLHTME